MGDNGSEDQRIKNRKLRQALSCAYDFNRMNKFMNNRLYPINGPIPKPLNGSLDNNSPFQYNLIKAKKIT